MKIDVIFTREKEFSIKLDDGSTFLMPTSLGNQHSFGGHVKAQSLESANAKISQLVDCVSHLLSLQTLTGARDITINNVRLIDNEHGRSMGQSSTTAIARIVGSTLYDNSLTEIIKARLQTLLNPTYDQAERSRMSWALRQMSDALNNDDPIGRFWSYYSILLALLPKNQSSRMKIDAFIKRKYTKPQFTEHFRFRIWACV